MKETVKRNVEVMLNDFLDSKEATQWMIETGKKIQDEIGYNKYQIFHNKIINNFLESKEGENLLENNETINQNKKNNYDIPNKDEMIEKFKLFFEKEMARQSFENKSLDNHNNTISAPKAKDDSLIDFKAETSPEDDDFVDFKVEIDPKSKEIFNNLIGDDMDVDSIKKRPSSKVKPQ